MDSNVPATADVIALNRRPEGSLRPGDLIASRRALRHPVAGEVVIRNIVTSVDPYQLQMLRGSPGHQTLQLGDPVPANSVGVVVASEDPAVPVGAQVATYTGWQSYATTRIAPADMAAPTLGDPLEWIGVLSTPGVTAYLGLHDIGQVRAGSTVLVSAATGAVGGVVVQLAKAAGARVLAIAGGALRADHAVNVLGADEALDYQDFSFPDRLRLVAGDGVDLFFDNVGGRQLTLALSVLKDYATVVLCGSVSSYARPQDADAGADLTDAVLKRTTLRGYVASDHYPERLTAVRAQLATLLRAGRLRAVVSEFDGLDRAPEALRSVFAQGSPYIGKRVVRISEG